MNRSEVRSVVVGVLATKRRRSVRELEAELRAAGPECPCDSIWLVKAGVGAAKALGLPLKLRASDTWAFKSVESLTSYLHGLLDELDAA